MEILLELKNKIHIFTGLRYINGTNKETKIKIRKKKLLLSQNIKDENSGLRY